MGDFNELDNPQTTETEPKATSKAANPAKQAMKEAVNAAMAQTLQNDPTYVQRAKRLRGSIEVINTLGFADEGNLVQAVSAKDSPDGKRKLAPEGKIVGYVIKNIGDEAIPVRTEKYTQDPATGRWVGNVVDVTLNPGETAYLTRKYLTFLAIQAEFSMEFANGSVVRGSNKVSEGDVDGLMEAFYFSFSDPTIKVHDPAIKVQIGEKVKSDTGEAWVVKAEFAEDFGYLNNQKEKAVAKRTRKAGPEQNEKLANYLRTLLAQG